MNLENAMENLKKRGFHVSYFQNRQMAADYMQKEIKGTTVGIGGSKTQEELGLFEKLSENNTVFCHYLQKDTDAALEGAAKAKVYITSANAVAETGELINIDGRGNRVAATLHGKEKVYFVVGVNKFTDDLDSAIWRARNIASPLNARRWHKKTPCASGEYKCYDCNEPDRVCGVIVIHMGRLTGVDDVEVVIVNENLGF